MTKLTLGERIKFIRHEKHLTLADFGSLLDPPANKGLVSRWEHDKSIPGQERLKQIAKIGNISLEYLKNGQIDVDKLYDVLHATDIGVLDEQEHKVIADSAFDSFAAYDINRRILSTDSREELKKLVSSHYKKFNNLSLNSKSVLLETIKLINLFEKDNIEADGESLNQCSDALSELLAQINIFANDRTAKNKKAAKTALNKLLDSLKYIDR